MPTLLRFRAFRIQIFTDDHGPPHVHAIGPGMQVSFFLNCPAGPVTLRFAERTRPPDENALAPFLNAHLELLCEAWGIHMIGQQEHDEAAARGEERMRTQPRAIKASFDEAHNLIVIEFNKGYSIAFPPQRSQVLASATTAQLAQIEIDFPGFSIYFPLLDEDLQVSSMLSGRFGNDRWEAAWAAAHPSVQAA